MHSSTVLPASPALPDQAALRQKIGALCHVVRFAGIAYIVWMLSAIVGFWLNEKWVIHHFGLRLKMDIGGVTGLQRVQAAAVDMLIWLILLGTVVGVLRLFGGFLKGSIFTVDAARHLRSVGLFGIATVALDLISQPVKALIMTAHLTTRPPFADMLMLDPASLLNFNFCAMLLALAHVFSSASELASDNAGII